VRPRCEIALQNPCRYPEASARAWRSWLGTVVGTLAPRADSLAVRFVSDREMRRLNRTYRHRDRPTDVLSFPGDAQPGEAAPTPVPMPAAAQPAHLGDVAVSVPTARRQAVELGHSVEKELRTLLLHGILHCLGYDHETDDDTMDREERRWRSVFVDLGDDGEIEWDDD
jgi:probable rRNA maturation factor